MQSEEGQAYFQKAEGRATQLNSYFKTHGFKTYGGELWLKFLVAFGDVARQMIECVNLVAARRTDERRGMHPKPDYHPANINLSRKDRAPAPVSPDYVGHKKRHERAMTRFARIYSMREAGDEVQESTLQAAETELEGAEIERRASGYPFKDAEGVWHNVRSSDAGGLFEMALYRVILDIYNVDEAEVLRVAEEEDLVIPLIVANKWRDRKPGKIT